MEITKINVKVVYYSSESEEMGIKETEFAVEAHLQPGENLQEAFEQAHRAVLDGTSNFVPHNRSVFGPVSYEYRPKSLPSSWERKWRSDRIAAMPETAEEVVQRKQAEEHEERLRLREETRRKRAEEQLKERMQSLEGASE